MQTLLLVKAICQENILTYQQHIFDSSLGKSNSLLNVGLYFLYQSLPEQKQFRI